MTLLIFSDAFELRYSVGDRTKFVEQRRRDASGGGGDIRDGGGLQSVYGQGVYASAVPELTGYN